MSIDEIIDEYAKNWIAASGLGRLDEKDSIILPTGEESVNNENGILFLAYFLLVCDVMRVGRDSLLSNAVKTVFNLYKRPGLLNRQTDPNSPRYEAHDNYVGAEIIGQLSKLVTIPNDIYQWGKTHNFNYNNIDPEVWKLEQQRQGGEVCFYKICADVQPATIEWVWMCVGFIVSFFKPSASTYLLNWGRISCMRKAKMTTMSVKDLFFYGIIMFIWRISINKNYGGKLEKLFRSYFHPNHPIVLLATAGKI